jgi:hypothetical protein
MPQKLSDGADALTAGRALRPGAGAPHHASMSDEPLTPRVIVVAERHASWQRVLLYPAAQRREVIRRCAVGEADTHIARELLIPLHDVRAINDVFERIPHQPA